MRLQAGLAGQLGFKGQDGSVGHRLQIGQRVDACAVVGRVGDRGQHLGQIAGGDTVDAQRIQSRGGQRAVGGHRVQCRQGQHIAGGLCQGFDFAHPVHLAGHGRTDGVVEQRQGRCGQARSHGGSDGSKVGTAGVGGSGVGGGAVGFGQDQAVGVDQGLHRSRVGQARGVDRVGAQRAGHGQPVVVGDAGDASLGKVCQRWRCA